MSSEVGVAYVSLAISGRGITSQIQEQMAGVAGTATASGSAAGAGMGTGLLGGLKKALPIVAIAAAAKGLYEVGQTFDGMADTIRVGTGTTGEALDDLVASAKNVGTQTPSAFKDIGVAVADLNTRLGLTGKPLEDMSKKFLDLSRITETDLSSNIKDITRVFGDWGISTADQSGAMDKMFRASQSTGIGINQLASSVVQFGAPLRQMGFGFEESVAIFSKFEKEGVNTNAVLAGMKIGLGQMSKAGEDPPKALARITEEIKNAGSAGEANRLAIELFGQRAGPDMAAAIREGRFELGDLLEVINNGTDTIGSAAEDTNDFSESWQMFKNKALVALAPAAEKFFSILSTGMGFVTKYAGIIVPLVGAIVAIVAAIKLWSIVQGVLNAVMAMNPIGLVVIAIAALIAIVLACIKYHEEIKRALVAAWDAIWGGIKWFGNLIWNFLKEWGPLILLAVAPVIGLPLLIIQHWDEIVAFFRALGAKIGGFLSDLWSWISQPFVDAWNAVSGFFTETLWPGISTFFTEMPGKIYDLLKELWEFLSRPYKEAWTFLSGWFTETFWPAVSEFFAGIPQKLYDLLKDLWEFLSRPYKEAWTFLSGWFSDTFWPGIKTFFAELPGKIYDALSDLWDWMMKPFRFAWAKLKLWFDETWAKIKGFFEKIPGYVTEGLSTLWSVMTGPFKAAWDWINEHIVKPAKAFFAWLTGKSASTSPTLSNLSQEAQQSAVWGQSHALGGFITSPEFALIGEAGPELILPLSDQQRSAQLLAQAGLLASSPVDISTLVTEMRLVREEIKRQNDRLLMLTRTGAVKGVLA